MLYGLKYFTRVLRVSVLQVQTTKQIKSVSSRFSSHSLWKARPQQLLGSSKALPSALVPDPSPNTHQLPGWCSSHEQHFSLSCINSAHLLFSTFLSNSLSWGTTLTKKQEQPIKRLYTLNGAKWQTLLWHITPSPSPFLDISHRSLMHM